MCTCEYMGVCRGGGGEWGRERWTEFNISKIHCPKLSLGIGSSHLLSSMLISLILTNLTWSWFPLLLLPYPIFPSLDTLHEKSSSYWTFFFPWILRHHTLLISPHISANFSFLLFWLITFTWLLNVQVPLASF